jgi:hydrogenase maturation protease
MVVVIGYGNPLRGDDGAGPVVAEALAAEVLAGVRVLSMHQLTPELTEVLAEADLALFVDAARIPETEGVQVLPVQPAERSTALGHGCDPGVLLTLTEWIHGRSLSAWMIGIPAADFSFGAGLSPCTQRGVVAALQEIRRLILDFSTS